MKALNAGELFKFTFINNVCNNLNNRHGLYLGLKPFYRKDGSVVKNHEIWLFGDDHVRIIDDGLLRFMLRLCENPEIF